ncbi:hypothetical protein ACFLYS_03430, partial [Chloroflexota bacterium]
KETGTMKKLVSIIFLMLTVTLLLCLAATPVFADPGDEHRNNNEGSEGQGATELHQNRNN